MQKTHSHLESLDRLADQTIINIAAGATCAYLGDERSLREYLVADEAARHLRHQGHTVIAYLFDDSMDPLNFRQLRVAVNKDESLIQQFQEWCGKPISHLPDPWDCHESFSAHFEDELMNRLHGLDCHLTLVGTGKLYARNQYQLYVRQVLEQSQQIMNFLHTHFHGYSPERLFWALCPLCNYIDETHLEKVEGSTAHVYCHRCSRDILIPLEEIRGKLNWKLDCAVRWAHFNIHVEPFNKAYLEPKTGSFVVAQAVSREFFGGGPVLPLEYGSIKLEKDLSYRLLESLAPSVLRTLLAEHPSVDLTISREMVVTLASRCEVLPNLSYLNFVKQILPIWLLTPDVLTAEQRGLLSYGIAFHKYILEQNIRPHLPGSQDFSGANPSVIRAVASLIDRVIAERQVDRRQVDRRQVDRKGPDRRQKDEFQERVKAYLDSLGDLKKPVLLQTRRIMGQEQGLPVTRFLFLLPIEYLTMVRYMLDLYLAVPEAGQEPFPSIAGDASGSHYVQGVVSDKVLSD